MSSTGYCGVYYHKRAQLYMAQIKQHGRWHYLGYYRDPEDAARVRDVAALRLQGPDAKLNFDGKPPRGITHQQILNRLIAKGVIPS